MNKSKHFLGIDISSDVFDVVDHMDKHSQYSNDLAGFKKFGKTLTEHSHCVMEVTGSYYQSLATWLHSKSIDVSVVNPLSVKRFIQMRLKSTKTDKADARMIRLYAEAEEPALWHPPEQYILEATEIHSLIALLIKQRTALMNKTHGVESKGISVSVVSKSMKKQIQALTREIEGLGVSLEQLIKEYQGDLLSRLCTIPGIGKKTAIFLIVLTQGFEKFENSKQLISYFGLNPTIRVSGTSVRGRSSISKAGNQKIRNLLFMCSFSASQHNKGCKEIYGRLVAKGKSKKLALIAVANKLLKQSLAIAKSGLIYDENFRSVNPNFF